MGRWALLLPALLALAGSWRGLVLAAEGQPPEVVTTHGRLRGKQVSVRGTERRVDVFLGVPFAKPPVGPLRFSPPQPAEPWTQLRDATSYPPICLQDLSVAQEIHDSVTSKEEQVSLRNSEDCLYLNIYTPANSGNQVNLPVMVWIHGGGLVLGEASTYDGATLAAYENVVVVAIQYRLGILGFYSTGDEHSRGNWGFLDQVAALRWIQENIAFFGGDPGSVTLFGESAGGCSVSGHVLSPASKGLFHKAISQSGVAIMPAIIEGRPERLAKKIAETAGCPVSCSSEMVSCLKEKTENEILETTLKMEFTRLVLDRNEQHTVLFPAVTDGVFYPRSPEALLAEKSFNNVPYIIGVNNHEFGWVIPTMLQFPNFTKGLDKETANQVLRSSYQFTGVDPKHAHLIAEEYLKDTDPLQLRDRLLELLGDVTFVAPSIVTARAHRDAGYPVYFYEFQHRPSASVGLKPDYVKADHGDEIGFVLGWAISKDIGTEEEKKLTKTVMKYWANFARSGTPNGDGLVNWPRYSGDEQYLEISITQKTASKLKNHEVDFWTKILPEKLAEEEGGRTEL